MFFFMRIIVFSQQYYHQNQWCWLWRVLVTLYKFKFVDISECIGYREESRLNFGVVYRF